MRHDAQGTRSDHNGAGDRALPRLRSHPLLGNLAGDAAASLVVFLVAVPLSMGIAVASGAPLVAGIIAAIAGGIVVASFGGSAVQVSGPAAGLTIIVADLVHTYGWGVTCLITVLAGCVQVALGTFRIARAALAISPAVIHGMLAGVGATIAIAQAHVVLGGSPHSSTLANLIGIPGQLADSHTAAVAVGAVTIGIMLLWPRLPDLGVLRLNRVPAALVAVTAATAIAAAGQWQVERVSLPDSLAQAWSGPALPSADQVHGVAIGVAAVAMVASVESLLCAIAMDRLHDGRRVRLDRELAGQGAGNIVSGAFGGLPVAGVVVRGTANVRAGARTPLACVLHGVWILVFVALFAPFVELIPMAALAGLLVFIGLKMVNLSHVDNLRRHHEASVYLTTLGGVVVLGLLEGVLVGFGLALLVSLRRLTRLTVLTEAANGRWHVVVQGSLTFLGVPRVTQALRTVPVGAHVDLDLNVDFMDHAAFESIHAWRVDHERTGGQVDIDEVHENWYERSSAQAAPNAKTPPRSPARWWAPWGMRPSYDREAPASGLLLAGANEYHASTARRMRSLLTRLAHRQNPKALFITCADSRVVPNVITASGPGDLFTLRNIGNLVPRRDQEGTDDSVGAAIEYAVDVLEVPSIVVCGHSHCGAMKALLDGAHQAPDDEHLRQLRSWLRHGRASLARTGGAAPDESAGPDTMRTLAQYNVVRQLENLLTYPAVRHRYDAGSLELTGMYFDLETARMSVLDEARGEFVAVAAEPVPGQRAAGDPEQRHRSPT
ncbi:carbonic anhydrase [Lipingzhangella halophila]|uniref:carbonic anhydrase n=1 Tax=Lipingzhangella halophila TaxID=1783352 RepID=A0A7W7W3Z7_9ACTN|nr:SulP family inorganic anion transporter [Lipingzhangella halophila]MBB4932220.1 carbonic anhydrase [Lipingzhangella halophila]